MRRPFVFPVAARYVSLLVQFGIVLLISRRLSQADAGTFFLVFGAVSATAFVSGFGLPDGLVKYCAEAIALDNRSAATRLVVQTVRVTLVLNAGVAVLVAATMAATDHLWVVVELGILWWFCSAAVFCLSQCLVGLGHPHWGATIFYSATNGFLVLVLVPYLLLCSEPKLLTVLLCNVGCSLLAAISGYLLVRWHTRRERRLPGAEQRLRHVRVLGAQVACSRLLLATLYWIPTWVVGWMLGKQDAAVMGAAGRFLVAVSAICSALKFVVRAEIAAAAAKERWQRIQHRGRIMATVCTAITLASIAIVYLAGTPVLTRLLGPEYEPTGSVLLVLLICVLAESLGGPVDEVLKITGHASSVLVVLLISVVLTLGMSVMLARYGLVVTAGVQAGVVCLSYATQLYILWRAKGILLLPYVSVRTLREHSNC